MDHVDPELGEVLEPRLQPLQVAGKTLAVERHGDDVLAQEPVVLLLTSHVDPSKFVRTSDVGPRELFDQSPELIDHIVAAAVQVAEERVDRVEVGAEADEEVAEILSVQIRSEVVENVVEDGVGDLLVHRSSIPRRRLRPNDANKPFFRRYRGADEKGDLRPGTGAAPSGGSE